MFLKTTENTGDMSGKTNNPNGRPKDVQNKKNAELRERISNFIDNNWSKVQADFESLDARGRLVFMEKMMSYSLPKLQSVQIESDPLPEEEKTIIVFSIPDNGRGSDIKVCQMNS